MVQVKTFPKGKMVKLKPKIAAKADVIAQERGTNTNALTNRVMRKYCLLIEKRRELEAANTMPTQTAQGA